MTSLFSRNLKKNCNDEKVKYVDNLNAYYHQIYKQQSSFIYFTISPKMYQISQILLLYDH